MRVHRSKNSRKAIVFAKNIVVTLPWVILKRRGPRDSAAQVKPRFLFFSPPDKMPVAVLWFWSVELSVTELTKIFKLAIHRLNSRR